MTKFHGRDWKPRPVRFGKDAPTTITLAFPSWCEALHLWFARPNWDALAGATAVGDPTSTREVQAVESVLTPECFCPATSL